MATIYQAGYVFKDDGTAVSGATVQLYQADTTTTVGSSSTTNSSGYWSLSTTTEHTSGYDVKITSGSSIRYRRGNDKLQLEELDIRNDTGNGQGGLFVANTTNNASNKVATFANRNSTRADGDEIYLSFELNDDGGNIHEFARITAEAVDVSNGSEDGQIRFGVSVGGTMTDVFQVNSSTSGATSVTYESGEFTVQGGEGAAGVLNLYADQGDDNADKWKINIADGGTMTMNSLISGSAVAHMTIAPNATVANSTTTIHGTLTMGSTAALTNAGLVAVANQSNITGVGTISSGTWQGTAIASGYIAADAITGAKIADDAIDSEHYTDGSVDTAHIADNQVTLAKMAGLARGKIIYGDASGDPAALAVGSANYVLTSDGTDISWAAATTGDITGVTAGNGLSGGGTSGGVTLALDLSELTDTAIANGDYIVFTDTTDSNATVKGDLADVATLFAGTGLTASNSVIEVDAAQTQITSVGTIGTGVWQGTVVAAAYLPDASTSAQGVSELATSAEVTTGTDTGRTVTPDALAGSVVFGTRYVQCVVFDFATDIAEGNGKFYFHIPAGLNGMDLVEVHSEVITAGNGSTVDVQIHNATDSSDMLSTSLTIDNTETGSDTASTSAVINTSEDDVATNDLIRIDVDGNGGDTTIAKGLIVTLGFRIP